MAQGKNEGSVALFVDDEPNILSALKRELHDWSKERSIEIRTASSAAEGLKYLYAEGNDKVAIIVSDLRMPEMLGSDFLLEVRASFPSIITILLTGFSEPQELMKAIKAGIFSYILKPWEPEYLKTELDKALEVRRLMLEAQARKKTIEEELKWAGEMQRAILKPSLQSSEGVEFRTSYRPVPGLYCSGDYYDVIGMGSGRYLILLGDVAGHGVKAAFVTGILKAIIYPEYVQASGGKSFSPSAFLSWLNSRMNFELRKNSDLLITFFAGLLDPQAQTITYANAGQTHPFIISGGAPRELPVSGVGIGFATTASFVERTEDILKGDTFFAFTDGLVEAGAKGGEIAEPSMRDILAAIPYGTDYHKRILEAALAASGASDFDDDVTILTARVL
jgi:sigma-B regulation protein RsbU (phosphoserine phosphatase)